MVSDVRSLGKPGHFFTNWATTYSCKPELYFEPETTDEIRQVLVFAREKAKKVKVVGYGHSPSDLACTTDYMISLKKYDKVLKVDKEKNQIKVQGGCMIKDLNNKVFPALGLAFPVLGTVSELTVAGVISTGTHGTGANYGVFSTLVVSMELMTAAGDILEISNEKNAELMPAVTLSLGSLGVILTVTLQCEPAYKLHLVQYPLKLNDVLENLDVHVKSSDHFRFFWFPHTDNAICYHANRTTKEHFVKTSWVWEMLVGYYLLQLLYWISTFIPQCVPLLNRVFFHLIYGSRQEKIDRSDHIFNFNCLFKQYVMEWAIPRDKTAVVLYDLKNWITANKFPAHFPVEVRFVKGDNLFLSPAYGQEACFINIIMYRPYNKFVKNEEYWEAFQKIVAQVGGRPHWAKDHKYKREHFEKLYPKFGEFCKIREKLDPNGMFLNANLDRVFGKGTSSDVLQV
ncbi:L-gulonolactone oxidase-like [Gigantopelta aegis]|uniref:L-gulonolactone oxidase-like n=1 Tax=Gigantopelta aegis TaxID=1735272 RepID=UPI001B8874E1|nr:L-gulonolactone oxidase-like [Gigantopelta aegis]